MLSHAKNIFMTTSKIKQNCISIVCLESERHANNLWFRNHGLAQCFLRTKLLLAPYKDVTENVDVDIENVTLEMLEYTTNIVYTSTVLMCIDMLILYNCVSFRNFKVF